MKTVILKNGAEEAEPLALAMPRILASLMQENPIAFYELVMLARDPSHDMWPGTSEILEQRQLITRGHMHDSIRNIVVSAVEGEGMEMVLTSPIKES